MKTRTPRSSHRWLRPILWGLVIGCGAGLPIVGSPVAVMVYASAVASLLAAIALMAWSRLQQFLKADELPAVALAVASDPGAFGLLQSFGHSMREMVASSDPIYRELAADRVGRLVDETASVAAGRIEYIGTEAWRSAYERLLRSRGLYRYRSVAYVRTPSYWRDEPGLQSMRLNYEMAESGLYVERIVIVPDSFWPAGETAPVDPVGGWVDEQVRRGVRVWLVKASLLSGEPDLLDDFGLYGNRAVGFQQTDDHGRTVRFTLSFDFAELLAAERRWERLLVYASELKN